MDVMHRMIVDDLKKAMEKDKKQNEVEFVSLDEESVFLHSECSLIALSKIAPKMKRLIRYLCKSGRNGDAKNEIFISNTLCLSEIRNELSNSSFKQSLSGSK